MSVSPARCPDAAERVGWWPEWSAGDYRENEPLPTPRACLGAAASSAYGADSATSRIAEVPDRQFAARTSIMPSATRTSYLG